MEDHRTATNKIKDLGITMGHLRAVTMVPKASMQNQGLRIMTKGRGTPMEKAYGVEMKTRKRERPSLKHQEKARCLVLDHEHRRLSSWWSESLREQ